MHALHAGTPQEQLATCDAIKPEERTLWEAQDILAGALPQALSEAFQSVEQDFLQTTKVRVTQCRGRTISARLCRLSYLCLLLLHARPLQQTFSLVKSDNHRDFRAMA